VSQQDQHLTTEQLSTFIDQQLTPEEQASCSAHLVDCEKCQNALDKLQQTVNLLRSLPQLEVPRSFALPTDFKITFDPYSDADGNGIDYEVETQVYENKQRKIEQATANRKSSLRKLPTPLQRTLRTVSALAAVVGLFFALSGLVATLSQFHSGGFAASSTDSMSEPAKSYADKSAPSTIIGAQSHEQTPVNSHAINNNGNNATSPAMAQSSSINEAGEQPTLLAGTDSAVTWPTLPFLDFNLSGVRLFIGILLAILGGMGFRLFARR
jgi:hypothetical protein